MKIKKYSQSCLFIETNGKKILFDPGTLKYQDKYRKEWSRADAIFVTHKHSDHINASVLKNFNIPIYSTSEVQDAYPEINFNIVKEGDILELGDVKVEVVKAIHGYNPRLKNVGEVFQNVGYILDDGKVRVYITSDTICFNNDYKADVVCLPVTGYGLTMTSYEASLFALELGARLVLPIHMDNEVYPTDKIAMKDNFLKFNINHKVLDIEESIEI